MGILDIFNLGVGSLAHYAANSGISSPWADQSSIMPAIAGFEALGIAGLPIDTKEGALTVASVARAHSLLTSTISGLPLRVFNANGVLVEQPSWAYRTDTWETPSGRMTHLVSDLIFYGVTALAVLNDSKGNVLQLAHVPRSRWKTDNKGVVTVDGETVEQAGIIIIKHPAFNGLLNVAAQTIRFGADLEKARAERAANPIPLMLFSHNNQDLKSGGLGEDEIAELTGAYKKSRQAEGGAAVGYIPPGLKAEAFGQGETDFFTAALNSNTIAIAQHLNIRASMVDGTLADTSSEVYKNAEGERNAFLVFDLPFWTRPIEDALSNDRPWGAVPRGQYVRFDFSDFYSAPSPTGLPAED